MNRIATLGSALLVAAAAATGNAQTTQPTSPTHPARAATHTTRPQAHRQQPVARKMREQSPGLLAQATITADSARRLASARVANGKVRDEEILQQNGRLVYSFDLRAPGKSGVEEVVVDAKTGEIVSQQHESAMAEAREKMTHHRASKSTGVAARKSAAPATKSPAPAPTKP